MRYALQTLWFERKRYLPGVMAVAFSALLTAFQVGIVDGLMSMVSFPIDISPAEVWVTSSNAPSVDLGVPINDNWRNRLWVLPEITAIDQYIQDFSEWKNPYGGTFIVIIAGCNLKDDSIGPVTELSATQRKLLTETGAVIINYQDRGRLGIEKVGETAEIAGQEVQVVGFTYNMGSLTGPYVLCSLATARRILRMPAHRTTYLIAKCQRPDQVPSVLAAMSKYRAVSTVRAEDFSFGSRMHWIRTTKAGIAVVFVAALGLAVGAVVTSQTLFSATIASIRELAVLRALGIPRSRMRVFVIQQSLVVGVLGLIVGLPLSFLMAKAAEYAGIRASLPPWLLIGTAILTLIMAFSSGLVALRSLRQAEPVQLLR